MSANALAVRRCRQASPNSAIRASVGDGTLIGSGLVNDTEPPVPLQRTSQVSVRRVAAAIPSIAASSAADATPGTKPAHVAVTISTDGAPRSRDSVIVAGLSSTTSSRASSLSAVATRTWSWFSKPTRGPLHAPAGGPGTRRARRPLLVAAIRPGRWRSPVSPSHQYAGVIVADTGVAQQHRGDHQRRLVDQLIEVVGIPAPAHAIGVQDDHGISRKLVLEGPQ